MPTDAEKGALGGGIALVGHGLVGGHNDIMAGQERGREAAALGAVVQRDAQLRSLLPHLVHPLLRLLKHCSILHSHIDGVRVHN